MTPEGLIVWFTTGLFVGSCSRYLTQLLQLLREGGDS